MNKKFKVNRLYLFTKTYAWYVLKQNIIKSKKSLILIKKLSNVLLFDKNDLTNLILNKNKKRSDQKYSKKILIYLQIEKELIVLIKERNNKDALVMEYEYKYALLDPAIERVAGNTLSHIESDHWFDKRLFELKRKYNQWYYETAYKYKLPTMRIVPFLIRLISSKTRIN